MTELEQDIIQTKKYVTLKDIADMYMEKIVELFTELKEPKMEPYMLDFSALYICFRDIYDGRDMTLDDVQKMVMRKEETVNELEQCPYDRAVKCKMDDGCRDCETRAEYLMTLGRQMTGNELMNFLNCPPKWTEKIVHKWWYQSGEMDVEVVANLELFIKQEDELRIKNAQLLIEELKKRWEWEQYRPTCLLFDGGKFGYEDDEWIEYGYEDNRMTNKEIYDGYIKDVLPRRFCSCGDEMKRDENGYHCLGCGIFLDKDGNEIKE